MCVNESYLDCLLQTVQRKSPPTGRLTPQSHFLAESEREMKDYGSDRTFVSGCFLTCKEFKSCVKTVVTALFSIAQ